MNEKDEIEYEEGNIVTHTTSGEPGVVTRVYRNRQCNNPKHTKPFSCITNLGTDCSSTYTNAGRYDISTGFDKTIEDVPGYLLKPVSVNEK